MARDSVAPGGSSFTDFRSFGDKLINDNGQVAFLGFLSSGDSGLFLSSKGTVSKIVGTGDPAPGGGMFLPSDSNSINNQGQVAFASFVSFPDRSGMFLFSEGQITQLVAQGDPAPGGGMISFVQSASLNDQGQVAFFAGVTPPSRSGIFLWLEGSISPIVQTGDPAPSGGSFSVDFVPPSLNGVGQVAFGALLSTKAATGCSCSRKGWSAVRPGDPAPGGGTFTYADYTSLNDAGQVAFPGLVSGVSGVGAFLFSEGTISRIAGSGDPAPGGGTFTFGDLPRLNAQAQATFVGGLSTGGNGAFLATPR